MKPIRDEMIAIFWGPHSRHTEDIARHLGATAYTVDALPWSHRRYSFIAPLKYAIQFFKTWLLLLRTRPSAVYFIIPPPFPAIAVYLYCLLAKIPYVMDVHGHMIDSVKWSWTIPLQRFLARRAIATVVDQRNYVRAFESWGAKTVMLERAPVQRPQSSSARSNDRSSFSVMVVNVFATDEPVDLVVQAAAQLPDVNFFITGDVAKAPPGMLERATSNVTFTGYLKGDDYFDRMLAASAVITLTTAPYSLVSGGIEALSLGRPNILSRQPLLEEYFTQGTVFVDNTVEGLVAGVRTARANETELTRQAVKLAAEKRERWEQALRELLTRIDAGKTRTLVSSQKTGL